MMKKLKITKQELGEIVLYEWTKKVVKHNFKDTVQHFIETRSRSKKDGAFYLHLLNDEMGSVSAEFMIAYFFTVSLVIRDKVVLDSLYAHIANEKSIYDLFTSRFKEYQQIIDQGATDDFTVHYEKFIDAVVVNVFRKPVITDFILAHRFNWDLAQFINSTAGLLKNYVVSN